MGILYSPDVIHWTQMKHDLTWFPSTKYHFTLLINDKLTNSVGQYVYQLSWVGILQQVFLIYMWTKLEHVYKSTKNNIY